MGHYIAGLILVIAYVINSSSAKSSLYDKYCTDPDRTSYFAPFPTDSSKFVSCQDGEFTVYNCNNGQLFDCDKEICQPIAVANTSVDEKPVVPDFISEYCLTQPNGLSVPSLQCNTYYVCEKQVAVELTCPIGQHYSRPYGACMNPLKAGCKVLETMCVGEAAGYKFAALQCDQYYICDSNEVPVLITCGEGLYYGMQQGECTLPDVSQCIPDETTTTTTTTIAPPTTTVAYGCPPNCNSDNNGIFYPHAKCNWFYMCFNNTALELQCECGQYYNSALKYCIQDTNGICKAS